MTKEVTSIENPQYFDDLKSETECNQVKSEIIDPHRSNRPINFYMVNVILQIEVDLDNGRAFDSIRLDQ
ncbi:hypothetical protein [Sporolactobacillus sp. KGMB 08714]|uniref:hypothetical protein n=1 Tax=Sporolactobacillus sp. KGMB 08714 TaxID=3064704 RepID=UPI002FBE1715